MRISQQIILASASSTRRNLLKKLIFHFRIIPPQIKEKLPTPGKISPYQYVQDLAHAKVLKVAQKPIKGIILGADTIVLSKGKILGKPTTPEKTRILLKRLSGTKHSVITGVCVFNTVNQRIALGYQETLVRMKKLSTSEIFRLSSKTSHLNKAGGYAIQTRNDPLIKIIKGRLDNAMGLPLNLVRQLINSVIH